MRIDEKHQCLSYYKSSAAGESPAGMIDLKVVKDITPYEKGKNPLTFAIVFISLWPQLLFLVLSIVSLTSLSYLFHF